MKIDKNLIINNMKSFQKSKSNDVNISLIRKVNRKNQKYLFYTATLLDNIKKDIINTLFDVFCEYLSNFDLKRYDPLYVHENTIEYIPLSDVPNFEIFKSELGNLNNIFIDYKKINASEINFYCCYIKDYESKKEALFFKNYRNPKMLRNYIPFKLIDKTLRKIENVIFYLDPMSDLLIFDDYIFIYNRNSLNTVFDYKDEFLKTLDVALSVISNNNIISNFDEFKEDCKQNILIAKQFTRIMRKKSKYFEIVINNFDKVPKILEDLGINIKFDDCNRIIYENKEDLNVIATIFSDGFARTYICERNIIAGDDEEIKSVETVVR